MPTRDGQEPLGSRQVFSRTWEEQDFVDLGYEAIRSWKATISGGGGEVGGGSSPQTRGHAKERTQSAHPCHCSVNTLSSPMCHNVTGYHRIPHVMI
jgi:hypothetical protein